MGCSPQRAFLQPRKRVASVRPPAKVGRRRERLSPQRCAWVPPTHHIAGEQQIGLENWSVIQVLDRMIIFHCGIFPLMEVSRNGVQSDIRTKRQMALIPERDALRQG